MFVLALVNEWFTKMCGHTHENDLHYALAYRFSINLGNFLKNWLHFVISEIHIYICIKLENLTALETSKATEMRDSLLVWCHSSVLKTRQSKLSWDGDVSTIFLAKFSLLAAVAGTASSGRRQTNVQYSQQPAWTGSCLGGCSGYSG